MIGDRILYFKELFVLCKGVLLLKNRGFITKYELKLPNTTIYDKKSQLRSAFYDI